MVRYDYRWETLHEEHCKGTVDSIGHNSFGPFYVSYFKNGLKDYEEYRVNGLCHRIDGPAREWRGPYYPPPEFYLRGKNYPFEKWIEYVKSRISNDRYVWLKERYG